MAEAKRRQYGSGSIFERSDGKWIGQIEAGWSATGTRRRIKIVAASEAACKAAIKARIRKLELEGAPAAGTTTRATVKSWAEVWLERTQRKVRPKTWANDASEVRHWIVPTIGPKRLDLLTPGDVRAVAVAIRKAGRSSSTARRTQQVLTKMLRDAVLEGHAIPPRVLMVEAPAVAVTDRDEIPLPDALAILEAAADRSDGSRWAAALLQGIRQGECLGLTWACVDLDRGLSDISWQLQAIPYEHGCGDPVKGKRPCKRRFGGDCPQRLARVPDGYEIRPLDGALSLVRPKTAKGQRIIPLVPWMVAALRTWRDLAPASPHDLVWPRPDGRPQRADLDDAAWYSLQDAAQVARVDNGEGRRYTIHECRHTAATLLMQAGVDDAVITAILGHSSIVTSRIYMHSSQDRAREALAEVAARLQLR